MNNLKQIILIVAMVMGTWLSAYAQVPTPADDATGVAQSTTEVSWTDFNQFDPGIGPYDVQFDDDPAFGSVDASLFNTALTSLSIPALQYNTTYYWRVRDTDIDGGGDGGALDDGDWHNYTFTTELATPVQATPANASSFSFINPVVFTWTIDGNYSNVDFTITVAEDAGYSIGVLTNTVSGVLTGNIAIPDAGTYFWKVDAEVTAGPNTGEITSTAGNFTFTMTINGPALVAPINGLTGVSILPTLDWDPVVGAASYKLYVDDAADFTTPLYEVNEGTNTVKTFDALIPNFPLDNGTLYYWRVSALDILNNEYYSAIYHFTTIDTLPEVTLSWPIDNILIYETPVTFGWYTASAINDLKFTLQYKYSDTPPADETFWTGTPANDADPFAEVIFTGVTNTQQPVLLTAKQYYWRVLVQSANDDAYIYYPEFDVYETFETIGSTNAVIVPSYPTDGALIYTLTPTLYWYTYEYSAGLKYQVKYGISAADVAPADGELDAGTKYPLDADIVADGITNLYYQLPTLTAGTQYFWQVRAYHEASDIDADPANGPEGWTAWSDIADFEITGGADNSIAVASWPIGNPTVYDNNVTLYWFLQGSDLGITGYEVKYRKTAAPGDWVAFAPAGDDANEGHYTVLGASTYSVAIVPDLDYGAQYFWAVYPIGATTVDPSGVGSFTLIETECDPVQIYPEDGLSIFTDEVTLSWYSPCGNSTITSYTVTYSQSDVMASPTVVPGIDPNTPQLTLTGLNDGASYYWIVTAHYPLGVTTQSDQFSFSTFTGFAPLVAPIAVNPNNVLLVSNNPTLQWVLPEITETSLSYEIQLADNPYFMDGQTFSSTELKNQVENLQTGKSYFWKVRSVSADGKTSQYSPMGQFIVGSGVTDVETDVNFIPSDFSVEQNYPNPFNPVTNISFSIPETGFITVKIFDMLGREVKTLISSEKNAGKYTVQWKGDNNFGTPVSSGTYIYRVTTGNQHKSYKMLLLK